MRRRETVRSDPSSTALLYSMSAASSWSVCSSSRARVMWSRAAFCVARSSSILYSALSGLACSASVIVLHRRIPVARCGPTPGPCGRHGPAAHPETSAVNTSNTISLRFTNLAPIIQPASAVRRGGRLRRPRAIPALSDGRSARPVGIFEDHRLHLYLYQPVTAVDDFAFAGRVRKTLCSRSTPPASARASPPFP